MPLIGEEYHGGTIALVADDGNVAGLRGAHAEGDGIPLFVEALTVCRAQVDIEVLFNVEQVGVGYLFNALPWRPRHSAAQSFLLLLQAFCPAKPDR